MIIKPHRLLGLGMYLLAVLLGLLLFQLPKEHFPAPFACLFIPIALLYALSWIIGTALILE